MAVLSMERPALAAGAQVEAVLVTAPAAGTAPALDLAATLGGHSFAVALTGADGVTHSIDVLEALRDALADGTASFWQQGPLATQARVEIPLAGSQRLVFDVTGFANGGMSVEAQFNNDRAMEAAGGRAAYDVTVTMDGQTVAQHAIDQGQYQNWHQSFANGKDGGQGLGDATDGWLNIRQDIAHLQQTGAIAEYDLTTGVAESLLSAFGDATAAPGWGDPLATNGVTQYMPATGARGDIGFTTSANTAWLMTQDIRVASYAMDQAEAAGGVPWNMWDAQNGSWLGADDYPQLWTDYRGGTGTPGDGASTGLTQQPDALSGWSLDSAHQPDLSFVPYLLTGERWMLDTLNAQASWNVVAQWPAVRGDAGELVVKDNQVRGAAWSLRQIDEAAWASPDGSAEKAYFTSVSEANWSWLVAQIPAWTAAQGEAHGWLPGVYGAAGAMPAWQQDYFASTAIAAASHGNADAVTFLEWQSNFLIGRFTHAADGFASHDGAAYLIAISDPVTGTPYQTWAEIGAEMTARQWTNGTGWSQSQGDYAQLALATLAGLAEVLGSTAAADAYYALLADQPPFTTAADFNRDPTFSIEAPALGGGTPPIPATPVAVDPTPVPAEPVPAEPAPAQPAPAVPEPSAVPSFGIGANLVRIGLSEDAWQGDARYSILLDGKVVVADRYATAPHAAGETGYLDIHANLAAGPHALTVQFVNDLWGGTAATDRNLYVNSVSVDGTDQAWSASLLSNGGATLNISATAAPAPQAPVAVPVATAPDVLRIGVSADAWQGNPRFLLFIDGAQTGGEHVSSVSHAAHKVEYVEVVGAFGQGPHELTVRFLNDGWGGAADLDRNLYVDSVTFNGTDTGQAAPLYTTGDAVFAF
ncbi:carbohydrate-binding domain-containing protein [Humitalea rosea]|nr:carbohydrate-binding domain-containing protein [Humitalea rosea]